MYLIIVRERKKIYLRRFCKLDTKTNVKLARRNENLHKTFPKACPVDKSIIIRSRIEFCIEWTHLCRPNIVLKNVLCKFSFRRASFTLINLD